MALQLIEINLSEELTRKKKKPAAQQMQIPPWFGIVVVVVVIGFAGFYLFVNTKRGTSTNLQRQVEALKPQYENAMKLVHERDLMKARQDILDGWKAGRVTYGEIWLRLAQIATDCIYFTEIKVAHPDVAADKTEVTVAGRASGSAADTVIIDFVRGLKSDPTFTNVFPQIILDPRVELDGSEKVFKIRMTRGIAAGGK